ncbi:MULTISPECIES: PEP-CTERM/exosortase system-associated acyltransferase [unclassified Roseibium]
MHGISEFSPDPILDQQLILPDYVPVICRSFSEINECLRLRYMEYCLSRGWEDSTRFPEGLERDRYDDDAVHILLKDTVTGASVGTVRIIYHDAARDTDLSLPSFELAHGFREHLRPHLQSDRVIELSRLTMAREVSRPVSRGDLARGIFPALALIKGVLRAILRDNVGVVVMTVARSLQRLLEKAGFYYHDVGIRIEHRGKRSPLFREMTPLMDDLYHHNRTVWHYITDQGATWPSPDATSNGVRLLA